MPRAGASCLCGRVRDDQIVEFHVEIVGGCEPVLVHLDRDTALAGSRCGTASAVFASLQKHPSARRIAFERRAEVANGAFGSAAEVPTMFALGRVNPQNLTFGVPALGAARCHKPTIRTGRTRQLTD